MNRSLSKVRTRLLVIASPLLMLGLSPSAQASTAYGTLNNFDCVNDVVVNGNPVECHGFEIELEDVHSTDITYTYDYNHYGIPTIREDNSDPAHPRVYIRWAAKKNSDGSWSAFTAIPSGPISPTDGHQFTNPSVNFGGEHFGVGYYGAPTAVRNFWLIDDGSGNLVHGPPVNIATPTFNYYPAVAQVQPVIVPPPPPAPPVFRFGDASWVKDIKTTTHNSNKLELNDLVDPDPDDPDAHDWTNGEPAEVETEWRILQTEFADSNDPDPANPNGELAGVPEELPDGDEIISRRYEFYKYIGPIDAESGEAMADEVGPDGVHGVGSVTYNDHMGGDGEWVEVTIDLSTVEVVGEFFGAQMSAFDIAPALGLIDHIPDGELGVPYADRTVVVAAGAAFLATVTGSLPDGTNLDVITGIFSGTPTAAGVFAFTVEASDTSGASVTKAYTVTIPEGLPLTSTIATSASPPAGGTTTGDGVYENGTPVIVMAANNPGYAFVNWTESGAEVSALPNYPFTVSTDRTLVANFVQTFTVATSAAPSAGGTTSGDGVFNSGTSVTVLANTNPGYQFVNWTENGGEVSTSASYNFTLTADRTLVANFVLVGCIVDADCADEDACTTDVCVANACEHQPIALCCNANEQCEDGDVCTRDVCTDHVCTFESVPTCCTTDAQCADADDCTSDTCANFECQHPAVPGCCLTDGECDDGLACTRDVCVNQACAHENIPGCCATDAECTDADACTNDSCVNAACVNEPVAGCCNADAECVDDDACTSDVCVDNACVHNLDPACCNTDAQCADANDCTLDACVNHQCENTEVAGCCLADADCDDGNTCTTDVCNNRVCETSPIADCCVADSDCDDGNVCTSEYCKNHICVMLEIVDCCRSDADCDDGDACTADACESNVCTHPDVAGCCRTDADCDDGDPCTGDACVSNVCRNDPIDEQPPTLTCPADVSSPADPGHCAAMVTYDPPVAGESCSETSVLCDPPSGSFFPLGSTTVECTASNVAGTGSCEFSVTVTTGNACPKNRSYWVKHPNAWPVESLMIGSQVYSKAELIRILTNSPRADASLQLAWPLIATMLSTANGSDPSSICEAVAHANNLLSGYFGKLPYHVKVSSATGQEMQRTADILLAYVGGSMTPACQP